MAKTYKAAVFEAANQPLVIKELELKDPPEGQILVKVLAAGVCYGEIALKHGHMGNVFPRVPGHEIIGDIVAVTSGEKSWKVGDRVGGPWHGGHDGTCKQCHRGEFILCENGLINGISRDGGYAEYAYLRSEAACNIPKDVDPAEYAPQLCAGVTVFNGIRNMNITPGGLVAVQGLGGLGHLAVQYASKMGYTVAAMSSGGSKEKFAKELGATYYIDGSKGDSIEQLNKLGGADMVVACAPNADLISALIGGIAPKGKLLLLAVPGPVSFNTPIMVSKKISVHGWPSGSPIDNEETVKFAQAHNIKCMIEKFSLADANKAMAVTEEGKVRFRSVIIP